MIENNNNEAEKSINFCPECLDQVVQFLVSKLRSGEYFQQLSNIFQVAGIDHSLMKINLHHQNSVRNSRDFVRFFDPQYQQMLIGSV